MISLLLAAVLAADAGFEPVVLDVAEGTVYLHTADGGTSDAPVFVHEGTYMDTETTRWVAANKAKSRAERNVFEEIMPSAKTLMLTFGLGILLGAVAAFALAWELFR